MSLQRVSDHLLLARNFDRLGNDRTRVEQSIRVIDGAIVDLRKDRSPGTVRRWTEIDLPKELHASSAVKTRIGAISRTRVSKVL